MSRSGYIDDCEDQWASIRWAGALKSAMRGKRGQAFFRELLVALDAMPVKALIAESLVVEGEFCTLGALGAARGLDMSHLDPEDPTQVGEAFGIPESLAREVVYKNDEGFDDREWVDLQGPPRSRWNNHPAALMAIKDAPEKRWQYMRDWVAKQIKERQ